MTRIHSDIQTIGELKDLPMIAPALPQKFTFDWPETQTMNVVADFAGKKNILNATTERTDSPSLRVFFEVSKSLSFLT